MASAGAYHWCSRRRSSSSRTISRQRQTHPAPTVLSSLHCPLPGSTHPRWSTTGRRPPSFINPPRRATCWCCSGTASVSPPAGGCGLARAPRLRRRAWWRHSSAPRPGWAPRTHATLSGRPWGQARRGRAPRCSQRGRASSGGASSLCRPRCSCRRAEWRCRTRRPSAWPSSPSRCCTTTPAAHRSCSTPPPGRCPRCAPVAIPSASVGITS